MYFSTKNFISKLSLLFDKVYSFVNKYSLPNVRNKKTTIFDAMSFKVYYWQINTTKEYVADTLNNFKKLQISKFISRKAYSYRADNIPLIFYHDYYHFANFWKIY